MSNLEIRTVKRVLKDLHILDKNARYMKAMQFNRLIDNIRRDGCLTSFPLIYRDVVLSGNHRVQAAIKAGLVEADCIEITNDIGPPEDARAVALQLSHNAIAGEDDPNVLRELYENLSYDEKLYSGVTDDMLKVEPIDLSSLSAGATEYQEVSLIFLPEQARELEEQLNKIKFAAKKLYYVARLEDFDRFFDALIQTKGTMNVLANTSAIRVMADLALERLAQLAAEKEAADGGTPINESA